MRQRRSAHYSVAPVQTFRPPTAGCLSGVHDRQVLERICRRDGRPDLLSDPRFATMTTRQTNRGALTEIIDGELGRQPTAHYRQFNGVLPVAPVLDLAQALDNPSSRPPK